MKIFKILFVLILCFALTSICYAQKNTVALVDAKSFYASENTITRLVNALKIANPNFTSLTAEEKDKEFGRIAKKCPNSKDETTKTTTTTLNANEGVVCIAIKDIVESIEKFKEKQEFLIILDINSCNYVTHLCETAVDVTKQFVDEYNSAKK
jgi:Skp family chaperone for outer membrane proteins